MMKRYHFQHIVITVYLAHQFLIALAGYFAVVFFPGRYDPARVIEIAARGLNRWDAGWYLAIAREGYTAKTAAFFPLYPLLIHLLSRLGISPETAGALVSNGALLGALAVFYRLARLDHDRVEAGRALWYLAFFPTAFFLSAIYTESLYLLLVLLAFYLARHRRWLFAALAGMLAAATRNMGVFLLLPLFWEYRQANGGKLRPDCALFGLIPLGLLFFMFYLKQHLGDPLAFIHAQQYWHRGFGWPWASFWQALVLMRADYHFSRQLLDLAFTLAGFVLFFFSLARERVSYHIFVFTGLLLPLFSPAPHAPLYSMPRFVLVLFPLYLTMARRLKGAGAHNFILALSAALFFFLYVIFARGRWVA